MRTYILGIDLGGTKVSAALLDRDGQIVGRARAKTKAWRDDEEVFQTIARTGSEALENAAVHPNQLAALGIGSPGPLDPETGYIIDAVNLKLKNFPLGPRLSESFDCPAVVDNDVNAGLYGEFKQGAARGASDALGVFVGTGIGGALIVNNALYRGFSKNAGEFGHMIIKAGGPRCGCGNRGCLEALASRIAIARDLRKAIKRGHKSSLRDLLGKRETVLPSRALKQAIASGDKIVTKIVRRAACHIGVGIGSLVNALGPQVVVVGGGVIQALGDDFIEQIDRQARKVALGYAVKDVAIIKAQLGDDAGVIGAALLASEAVQLRDPETQ